MSDQSSPVLWPQFSPPRIALRKLEAAKALGISDETFDRYVRPHVRCIRWGSLRLYPVAELVRFAEDQSAAPLESNGTKEHQC